MVRTFEDKPATRTAVQLLIGLMGASGSGKTYSALRLATGIQRVTGGDIFVVDTESRRSLHYADIFKFRHIEFTSPFGPLDYLAAIEHCVTRGAKTIVVDSCSHEHEGPGGVLEMHEAEVERLAQEWSRGDERKLGGLRKAANLTAWAAPKAQRRRLINSILQLGCNAIFCFRAKEKIKPPEKGEREVKQLGWMPIAGEEWVYEMTANCLLYPGSRGTPEWSPSLQGERQMVKLPSYLQSVLVPNGSPPQLSEAIGEAMARWAAGDDPFARMMARITSAAPDDLKVIAEELHAIRTARSMPPAQHKQLVDALKARSAGTQDDFADAENDGRAE